MNEMQAPYEAIFCQPILKIKINNLARTDTVAFYVYRNGRKVLIRWYEKDPTLVFNTEYKPGQYHVRYFINNGKDIQSYNTRLFYLNERAINMALPEGAVKKGFSTSSFLPCQLNDKFSFHCLFKPYDNKRLFVLLPSALSSTDRSRPHFHRARWMKENLFKGNILCVADPLMQLYPKMFITWMVGDQNNDYLKNLAKIVKKTADSLNLDEIVFYGSSSGGFDAIWLASEVDGSTAIAINPQTSVLDYHLKAHVDKFRQHLFNNVPIQKLNSQYADRIDLKAKYSQNSSSRFFIIQNLTDLPHYYNHFLPYFSLLQAGEGAFPAGEGIFNAKNHMAWLYNSPGGHIPETKEMCLEALKTLNLD